MPAVILPAESENYLIGKTAGLDSEVQKGL